MRRLDHREIGRYVIVYGLALLFWLAVAPTRMLVSLHEQALFEWYVTEGPGASG